MTLEDDAAKVHLSDQWKAAAAHASEAFHQSLSDREDGTVMVNSGDAPEATKVWDLMMAQIRGVCIHLGAIGPSPFGCLWESRILLCPVCVGKDDIMIGLNRTAAENDEFFERLNAEILAFLTMVPEQAPTLIMALARGMIPLALMPKQVEANECDRCERVTADGFHESLIQVGPAMLSLNLCESCYDACAHHGALPILPAS